MISNGKFSVYLYHVETKRQLIAHVKPPVGKAIKTKTVGYGSSRTIEQAYNALITAAKKLAQQYKADLIHKTLEQLKNHASSTNNSNKKMEENPLIAKFGNEMLFKAMIKHAIKTHGTEKTSEVLKNALLLVKEVEHKQKRDQQLISTANLEMARIVLNTRKQGLDMDAPNKDIEAAVQWLMDNESSVKSSRQTAPNASYMLNGEHWNGKGHAPASFAKFLRENEDKTLDDLRV